MKLKPKQKAPQKLEIPLFEVNYEVAGRLSSYWTCLADLASALIETSTTQWDHIRWKLTRRAFLIDPELLNCVIDVNNLPPLVFGLKQEISIWRVSFMGLDPAHVSCAKEFATLLRFPSLHPEVPRSRSLWPASIKKRQKKQEQSQTAANEFRLPCEQILFVGM